MNEELTFGKGAIREDIPDPRDYKWGVDVGMATPPFDWEKGFSVEEEVSKKLGIPFKLPIKNQNGSSSCGGQAWAYLGQILDTINDKITEEKSAKFIYAQTHVGTGGSDGRTNSDLVIKQGWGNEIDCPSLEADLTSSEAFMIKDDISPIAKQNALKDRGLAYATVLNRNVENIATALRDNYGCIMGISGSNNSTWRTSLPKPPITFVNFWNHWLMCIGAISISQLEYDAVKNGIITMEDLKKKYLYSTATIATDTINSIAKEQILASKEPRNIKLFEVINSWGANGVGENGHQWLSEEYITKFILGYPVIWAIFTMVAKADVVIPPPYKFTKVLKYGMRNGDVKMLQMKLGGLITDGYFGRKTEAKVKEFQKLHNLIADGVVGTKTNEILNSL